MPPLLLPITITIRLNTEEATPIPLAIIQETILDLPTVAAVTLAPSLEEAVVAPVFHQVAVEDDNIKNNKFPHMKSRLTSYLL